MALTDENTNNMIMPVQPMGYGMPYSGGGMLGGMFGGGNDWLGLLFLIALCNGGFGGFGFGGGYGAMMGAGMMGGMYGMDFLYPWLNNSQNINDGFRGQQLATQVNGIQNAITSGFGDVQLGIAGVNQNICQTGNGIQNAVNQGFANTNLGIANGTAAIQNSLCNGFNGVNNGIFNAQAAIAQQLNTNEMANLNRSFAEQTANTQGFNNVQAQLAQNGYNQATGTADLKYAIAQENCADRQAISDGIRDVITSSTANSQAILNAINSGIQSIKDDICADRLAASQRETEAERRENANLRSQLNMAVMQNSINSETDLLYNRLKSCPIPSVPVYGNQSIFTCPNNGNNGCGCGSF